MHRSERRNSFAILEVDRKAQTKTAKIDTRKYDPLTESSKSCNRDNLNVYSNFFTLKLHLVPNNTCFTLSSQQYMFRIQSSWIVMKHIHILK